MSGRGFLEGSLPLTAEGDLAVSLPLSVDGDLVVDFPLDGDGRMKVALPLDGDARVAVSLPLDTANRAKVGLPMDGDGRAIVEIARNLAGRVDVSLPVNIDDRIEVEIERNVDGQVAVALPKDGAGRALVEVTRNGDGRVDVSLPVNVDDRIEVEIARNVGGRVDVSLPVNVDNRIEVEVERNVDGRVDVSLPVDGAGRAIVEIVRDADGRVEVALPVDDEGRALVSVGTDAFGRLRVASPLTQFDSKQIYDKAPLIWDDQQMSGAGTTSTYNANQASTTIAVANLTAGRRVRQTFRSIVYQPGKSTQILMTGVLTDLGAAAGITTRFGQMNEQNGLGVQLRGLELEFIRRTFTSGVVVDNVVAQADWNIDRLDGTGPSGLTINLTKTQILAIDYEWLGVGAVRLGFVINKKLVYCHQMNHANNLATVYMSTPNLPLRYEIINDGTGPARGLTHICATVMSEGGSELAGFDLAVTRGSAPLAALNNNNQFPLVAIRLNTTQLGVSVVPKGISVVCTSTATFRWMLLLNPTIVGTALVYAAVPNSAVQAALASTNATTVTGGTQLASGYAAAGATGDVNLPVPGDIQMGATLAGVSDVLVLAVQMVVGGAETYYGGMTWHESR